jgi:hypothetical protein
VSRSSLLVLPLLTACGIGNVTEENFAAKAPGPVCNRIHECDLGYFESEFKDIKDCEDEYEHDFEDLMEAADDADCDFDADEARLCLQTIQKSTCEEWYEGDAFDDCDDVFGDCGFF